MKRGMDEEKWMKRGMDKERKEKGEQGNGCKEEWMKEMDEKRNG
jgi:hypothetical protein